jgi:hypothetical protein
MARALERSILVGFALAGLLAGCSPAPILEQLPASMGGLPRGAPAAPTKSYQYPAVHDMPPPRATKPLDEEQQEQLRQNLETTRDRQEQRTGTAPKAAPKRKNNTTDPKMPGSDAGARVNP